MLQIEILAWTKEWVLPLFDFTNSGVWALVSRSLGATMATASYCALSEVTTCMMWWNHGTHGKYLEWPNINHFKSEFEDLWQFWFKLGFLGSLRLCRLRHLVYRIEDWNLFYVVASLIPIPFVLSSFCLCDSLSRHACSFLRTGL